MNRKVMLVDGMALLFRAFFATSVSGYFKVNSKGIPTNAIHGFVRHLFMAMNRYNPSHVVCCWDMGSKTFRNEIYPPYKANRSDPPPELVPQFDLVKDVVTEMNIPNIGMKDYEADDCIGTLAQQYKNESEVIILTGDHDMLQLISPNVKVAILKKGYGNYQLWDEQLLLEEKGITPQQFIDMKGLMGDSSDNYPGVKGIGEKTAIKLLKKYQSIDGILTNLESLTPTQQKRINDDLEILNISRKLAEIHCEVAISCTLEEAQLNINREQKKEIFKELEFDDLYNILNHYEYAH